MAGKNTVTLLNGDRRRLETRLWQKWLKNVPRMRTNFHDFTDGFDPFHSNETASVAVLANAATVAGFLSNTEYIAFKRHATAGPRCKERAGRCDLWLADLESGFSWAFEFKQHFAAAGIRETTFARHSDRAFQDAKAVDKIEADRRVGGLILVPPQEIPPADIPTDHFDQLCKESHLAFRIEGGLGPIWIAFNFVEQQAKGAD